MLQKSGIYKITDLRNGKSYIGRSNNLSTRRWKHFCYCHIEDYSENSMKPEMKMLIHQAMIESHNELDFSFEIIEYCEEEQLDEKEQYYIKFYNTLSPNGYNSTIGSNTFPHLKGEQHFNSKLTEKEVQIIKQLLKEGKNYKDISNQIPHVSINSVSSINNGYSWFDPTLNYPISKLNGVIKVTPEEVREIKQRVLNGEAIKKIYDSYKSKITRTTIENIIYEKTHKDITIENYKAPIRKKKHKFTQEEVEYYRKQYFVLDREIIDIYKEYLQTNSNNDKISENSFREMVKGITYVQYKIYPPKPQKTFEETLRGQKKIKRENKIERNKKIIQLLDTNRYSKKEIAKLCNCSVRTIY